MATDPVRTGNDQVDRDMRLYMPLNRTLGLAEMDHLAQRVRGSVVNQPSRTPDQIAQDAVNALRDGIDDLVCAYHPDSKTWRWYNTATGQWGGPC